MNGVSNGKCGNLLAVSGPRSESSNGEPWYIDPVEIQKSQQQILKLNNQKEKKKLKIKDLRRETLMTASTSNPRPLQNKN